MASALSLTRMGSCGRGGKLERDAEEKARQIALAETLIQLSGEKDDVSAKGQRLGDEGAAKIANALARNTTVKLLQLDGNLIGDIAAARLGDALKQNTTLRSLDLDVNEIGDIGATSLGEALKLNRTLRSLELHSNSIGNAGAVGLAAGVRANAALRTLLLTKNSIGDKGADMLAHALETNVTLCELFLGHNLIGDEGAKKLGKMLCTNTTMNELHLEANNIRNIGASSIASALERNSSLKQLWLLDNPIGDIGLSRLEGALTNNKGLQRLGVTIDRNGERAQEHVDALRRSHMLRRAVHSVSRGDPKVQIKGEELGDHGACRIAEAIENADTLRELLLENCKIGDRGAVRLATAIESSHSLASISLAHNAIGDHGATCLSRVLRRSNTLEKLLLDGNPGSSAQAARSAYQEINAERELKNLACVRPEAFEALQEALSQIHWGQRSVQLTDVRVGDAGVVRLIEALQDLRGKGREVKELMLEGCDIGDYGASRLARLCSNRSAGSLEVLCLKRNHISDLGAKELLNALEHNQDLVCLELDDNKIDEEMLSHILGFLDARLHRIAFEPKKNRKLKKPRPTSNPPPAFAKEDNDDTTIDERRENDLQPRPTGSDFFSSAANMVSKTLFGDNADDVAMHSARKPSKTSMPAIMMEAPAHSKLVFKVANDEDVAPTAPTMQDLATTQQPGFSLEDDDIFDGHEPPTTSTPRQLAQEDYTNMSVQIVSKKKPKPRRALSPEHPQGHSEVRAEAFEDQFADTGLFAEEFQMPPAPGASQEVGQVRAEAFEDRFGDGGRDDDDDLDDLFHRPGGRQAPQQTTEVFASAFEERFAARGTVALQERRRDPEDGVLYSYENFLQRYSQQYSPQEMEEYWNYHMKREEIDDSFKKREVPQREDSKMRTLEL